jgi:hypothetical protein
MVSFPRITTAVAKKSENLLHLGEGASRHFCPEGTSSRDHARNRASTVNGDGLEE